MIKINRIHPILFLFLLIFIVPMHASDTIQSQITKGMPMEQVENALGKPEINLPPRGTAGESWVYPKRNIAVVFDSDKKVAKTVPVRTKQPITVQTKGAYYDGYLKYINFIEVSYSDKIGLYPAKVKYSLDPEGNMESNRKRSHIKPVAPMRVSGTVELTIDNKIETFKIINIIFTKQGNIFGGILVSQTPGSLNSSMLAYKELTEGSGALLGDPKTRIDNNKPILLLRINSDFSLSHYTDD